MTSTQQGGTRNVFSQQARSPHATASGQPVSRAGSDDSGQGSAFGSSLAAYVGRVAVALGIPVEGTMSEVRDTATAYLGLAQRWGGPPARNLMLVWDERFGWCVAVEPAYPGEPPEVIAYCCADTVPAPATVARFVTDTIIGRHAIRRRPDATPADRAALGRRMSRQL